MTDRSCKQCNAAQPDGQFGAYRIRGTIRRRLTCNSCRRKAEAARYAADPAVRSRIKEAATRSRLSKTYGLTIGDLETMTLEQRGLCAICARPLPLCVDHDHKTGQVRGLLCKRCNFGIGSLRDNADVCSSASEYLERHQDGPHWQFAVWLRGKLDADQRGISPNVVTEIKLRLAEVIRGI